jgi:glycosyltransferase involved in cell wall biosynthesis
VLRVDICVFAHNEAATIGRVVAGLAAQTLLADPDVDLRVRVMANGCSDDTAAVARAAADAAGAAFAGRLGVTDLALGGKSRTWNAFVHGEARPDADLLFFLDGDIRLDRPETLARMAAAMAARPALRVFTSRPVKDIVRDRVRLSPVAALIARAGGGLTDFRRSICGQLYVLRAAAAREIWMPVGLPVEDGFLRAMLLTDFLSQPEDLSRIDGDEAVEHVYESLRTVGPLLRHQTRVVIGAAVNAALFGRLRRTAPGRDATAAALRAAAADPDWLAGVLREELPRAPYGYVPPRFLGKRLGAARRRGGLSPGALATLAAGLVFDAVVYVMASVRMARGAGAGHW